MKTERGIKGQFLVAERGGRQVALPLSDVRGGLPRAGLESIPRGESEWLGVMAVRGEIVVALKVDSWLDLEGLELGTAPGALVLFRAGETTVALAFDRLRGVVTLTEDNLKPHPLQEARPWLEAVYSDDSYDRLDVVNGAAWGVALVKGGRVTAETS
jgi:chemotaxis signal transduction protein